MAIWSLIVDMFGPKWAICRPTDSIVRHKNLSCIQTITIKELRTTEPSQTTP